MTFTKAERKKTKLRLAISGTAGSGKTLGALLIAQGLGGNIAMIDTENGSGNVYASMCDYDICGLSAPYHPHRYIQLIHEAEKSGYNVIIIDSLSHEWSGIGGCLDIHANLAATKYKNNSYAAWREVTPLHDSLIQSILASPCHIIATLRAKTEYVQTRNEKGFTEIQKAGLAPVQREGLDYEFGTVFDVSQKHLASASKDRTGLFGDLPFQLSKNTGERLLAWLDTGTEDSKGGEA